MIFSFQLPELISEKLGDSLMVHWFRDANFSQDGDVDNTAQSNSTKANRKGTNPRRLESKAANPETPVVVNEYGRSFLQYKGQSRQCRKTQTDRPSMIPADPNDDANLSEEVKKHLRTLPRILPKPPNCERFLPKDPPQLEKKAKRTYKRRKLKSNELYVGNIANNILSMPGLPGSEAFGKLAITAMNVNVQGGNNNAIPNIYMVYNYSPSLPRKKPVEKQYNCRYCSKVFPFEAHALAHEARHLKHMISDLANGAKDPNQLMNALANGANHCIANQVIIPTSQTIEHTNQVITSTTRTMENTHQTNASTTQTIEHTEQSTHEDKSKKKFMKILPKGNVDIANGLDTDEKNATLEKIACPGSPVDVEKRHECSFCGKRFQFKCYLVKHEAGHSDKRPFECETCKLTFKTKSAVTRHRRSCLNIRPYQCEICSKRFLSASNVKVHSLTHTGNRQHECETCGKKFKQSGVLGRHKLIHSDIKPFKCEICGKEFRQKIGLTGHKLSHNEARPYNCSHCEEAFKTRRSFAKHVITHVENPEFQCCECGERFLSEKLMQRHTESFGIDDTYCCQRCCLVFSSKCVYVKHKQIHVSTKICTSCGKVFGKKSGLIKHEKLHKRKSKSLADSDVKGCDLSHVETCNSTEVPYECMDQGGKELRGKRGTKLGSKRAAKSKRGTRLRSGDRKTKSGKDKPSCTNSLFGSALNGTDVDLGISDKEINHCEGLPDDKKCNSGQISTVESNLIDQCLGDWQGIDINQDLLEFDTQEGMISPEKNSSLEETCKEGGNHGMGIDLPVKVVDIEKDREPLGNAPELTNNAGDVTCHRPQFDDPACDLDVSKIDALVVESFKVLESVEQVLEHDGEKLEGVEQKPVDVEKPEDVEQVLENADLLISDHDYCKEIVETSESG